MDPVVAQRKLLAALQAFFSHQAEFEEYGWRLEPPIIYIWMHPRGKPDSQYLLRITFENFPDEAPSYVPVNSETRQPRGDAWPSMSAYKPDWPGFCLNGTREFYKQGHPDRQSQWSPETFPVARVLQEIQVELNKCG
ncbi:MAG: hypothetical protein L0338_36805 [Acidobacteria bacterium]|nr:hypothetical protein [Acidobacteriota bacterium]